MSFTDDPVNNIVDRVRLFVGDAYPDFEFLSDSTYLYLLSKYSNNEKASAKEAAIYILGTLTKYARERTGDIEVYGSEWFKNYRNFLLDMVNNPNFSFTNSFPYAGGISKQDMLDNDLNSDNVRPQVFEGMSENRHVYEDLKVDSWFEV